MISINGYTPFSDFYRACRRLVLRGYFRWLHEISPTGDLPALNRKSGDNIVGAAQHLTLNYIDNNWGSINILLPSSAVINLSSDYVRPDYYHSIDENRLEDHESIQFYRSDGWQERFHTQELYLSWGHSYSSRCILDWENSSLDLDRLAAVVKARRLQGKAQKLRSIEPATTNNAAIKATKFADDRRLLSILKPYRDFPVLVPDEWKDAFALPQDRVETDTNMAPWARILEYRSRHPNAKKSEVKAAIFPDNSERAFTSYWSAAARIDSSLSKPGRRPQPSD